MKNPTEDGHPQDAQVKPGSPVGDVVQVELDALANGSVAAPAVDLGPAGDAGFDAVPGHVVGNGLAELVDEHRPFGPGTHQAHVALENIKQLR